ncbi:MAG: hypothetical protein Q8P76_01945 [bacterium]|nr:hypothetical protein [bacterium]
MKTLLKIVFSALLAGIVLVIYLVAGMPKNVAFFLVIYIFFTALMMLVLGPPNPSNKKPSH